MKSKIISGFAVAFALVGMAWSGEYIMDFLKSDSVIVYRNLGVGTPSPNHAYVMDVVGATRFSGSIANTGAFVNTGDLSATGSVSGATVLATGLFQLPQVSSTALVSLVPGREGAAVWNTTRKTVCLSTSAFAKSWMRLSTGTLTELPNLTCIE